MKFQPSKAIIATKTGLPPAKIRLANAAREVVSIITSAAMGAPLAATDDQRDARRAKCLACSYYRAEAYANLGGCSHPKCGCCMRAKRWFYAAACPIGQW